MRLWWRAESRRQREFSQRKMDKLFAYSLLRHLPGRIGNRYQRKYLRVHARARAFPEALHRSQGTTCIDLGANVGEYTRRLASSAKRVIAFEPDPWTLAALQANVADLENVRIEQAAAGTYEGWVLLYRHARFEENPALYSESSSLIARKRNVTDEGAIEVRQIDFIDYLQNLNEDIGIIKIDIEGAEVDLLEALLDRPDIMKRIEYIFVETHETRIQGHELRVKLLQDRVQDIQQPLINLHWS